MEATLKITEPAGRDWQYTIFPGKTITIGRAKENDIVLNDRRVSRRHAFIFTAGSEFKLVDGSIEDGRLIRSVNHVYVNGVPLLEAALKNGDVVVIGESRLEFQESPSLSVIRLEPAEVRPKTVNFDDSPMGHTQVQISVNDILGGRSFESAEASVADPAEVKSLRRKAKILELLFEMSKTLGTVFDLEEIFGKATDLIFRGTPADRVIALLADENGDGTPGDRELYQIGAKTRDASFEELTDRLTVSRTITQKVMAEQVAVLSQDAKTDEQFQGAESIVSQGVRSTICAPLLTQSNVHGVLYADRLDPFAAFTSDHLELISAIAALTAVTVETVRAHDRLAREEVARANYGRFMPEYVVRQLLEDPDSFRLGGANQTITVLFADIRGFTSISERANPEKVVGLLNQYFSAMTEIIFEHGGTLDKYIGDELMALFGAPTATPDDARNAVKVAVAMQKRMAALNADLVAQGYQEIAIGIGLHTGVATVGYIGSEKRSEYTAIGDTVNLASRLQSNSERGQILISEATAAAAGDIFPMTKKEPLMVKNRVQPVELFEVKWA